MKLGKRVVLDDGKVIGDDSEGGTIEVCVCKLDKCLLSKCLS